MGRKPDLSKTVSTRNSGATVYIHSDGADEIVGQIEVEIINDQVYVTIGRKDESWFGRVNIQVV